jgi:hypothetical protein
VSSHANDTVVSKDNVVDDDDGRESLRKTTSIR